MLQRVLIFFQNFRRFFKRSEWAIRLLRLSCRLPAASEPGLLMIQIDGLSKEQFEKALAEGRMPFLARLLKKEQYRLHSLYSGLPSSTPAAQGELFYGVKGCVPEFSFLDRESGKVFKMYDPSAAAAVERRLQKESKGLLDGGSSYSNVFTGGAAESHFCAANLGWDGFFRAMNPLVFPLLFLIYLEIFLRTAALLVIESVLAVVDCIRGSFAGKFFFQELKYVPTRVVACILLRELVVAGVAIDLARGLPVIHANFIAYDEQSHRRGPGSLFAHWSLRGIDDAIRRLWQASHSGVRRDYDIWIHSDHGQEDTRVYQKIHHFSLQEAVDRILKNGSAGSGDSAPDLRSETKRKVFFHFSPGKIAQPPVLSKKKPGENLVVAMGPVGILYLTEKRSAEEMENFAKVFVEEAKVANVLLPDGPDRAVVWSKDGRFELPRDARSVIGEHPFLEDIAADLVRLCHHPDAGDCVFLGWGKDGTVTTFMPENGTHAGPGLAETQAFLLAPEDAPLPYTPKAYLRHSEVGEAARSFLGYESATIFSRPARPHTTPLSLRVMTYNMHSAIGMDGRISPDRIARIIARHSPDVIALQELDVILRRTGGVDQIRYIADKLKMSWHFHPSFVQGDGQYGNAVLSRFPMKLVEVMGYPKNSTSPREEPRGALWVSLDVHGTAVNLINTHLSIWPKERLAQIDFLCRTWIEKIERADPLIACGDFNAMPGSGVYRRISRQLKDAQKHCEKGGPKQTWCGGYPLIRIDHVFINSFIRVSETHAPAGRLERVASDHLPLIVDMRLPGP